MNEFLATVPFDLYELSLFHLVAENGSFTKAGQKARLTQSAITRQIRGVEEQLGVALFERTTRHVSLTEAGKLLYTRSKPILASAEETLKQIQQDFHLVPKTLRVGVARSIGLAYYAGFFFAFRRKLPEVQLQVVQLTSREILEAVESRSLDVGLLSPPRRLPRSLVVTHRFEDEFRPRDAAGSSAVQSRWPDVPELVAQGVAGRALAAHRSPGRNRSGVAVMA